MVLIDGSKYPERWASSEVWQSVKSSYRAVVSTPQVLLDALGHSFIKLGEDIGLLVFDEAHNATGNHPYSLIMNVHYRELRERKGTYPSLPGERPWVLGLSATASEYDLVQPSLKKEKLMCCYIEKPRKHCTA